MTQDLKKIIKQVPNNPGCYKYFDKNGKLIYIGKAKNLKKRVSSYFVGANDPKTTVLVENIADIKWEITESEIEALVLESLLIKKYKPKFNIKIKDDKDFLWVKIDMGADYPMPELVRRPNVGAGLAPTQKGRPQGSPLRKIKFFGPFTDSRLLKEGMTVLRKIFLWRDCSASKFSFYKKKGKPCLEYYIKNCSAPCQISSKFVSSEPQRGPLGAVSNDNNYQIDNLNNNHSQLLTKENGKNNNHSQLVYIDKNDYQLGIKQLVLFLQGKKGKIIRDLGKEMKRFAKAKKFEEAVMVRDKLKSLQQINANLKIKKTFEEAKIKDLEKFIDRLNLDLSYNLANKKDFRIEFYDISNISGSEAVGSMVVYQGKGFNKSEYRKFKIKTVRGINDYKMMEEVLRRRIMRTDWRFPDLFVMDGGKGQLGTIQRLFWESHVDSPIVSLAKREEEVFGVKDGKFKKTNINKQSPEGFFIQRLRDEAHRFAIGYHKNLRSKTMIGSRLDEIEGVGPKLKKKLILKFGSVEGIIKAPLQDVENEVGKKLARKIKESL